MSSDLAEALHHQCALEEDAEARHLAHCVTALLLDVESLEISSLLVPTKPGAEEWGALGSLFGSARTAEAKERVLHSMGSFVVHNIHVASNFLEVLRSGCNSSDAPSTRLACISALQASGNIPMVSSK